MYLLEGEVKTLKRPKITLTCLRQPDADVITSCEETLNAAAKQYVSELLDEPEPLVEILHREGTVQTYISFELMHRMAMAYNARLEVNKDRKRPKLIWRFNGFDCAGNAVWKWRPI